MFNAQTRTIIGSIAGNALEWYDFMIFAFLVPIISDVFFGGAGHNAILFTTILFGTGFLTRPLGGLLLGMFADRHGTGRAMVLGMGIMALSILMIACAPGWHMAGLAGAGVVVVARLLQGFSSGAEFATATSFLIEKAPPGQKGFYGSWQMVGQATAQILGSGVGFLLSTTLSPAALRDWGWRIPFALGLAIVPAILLLRQNAHKAEARSTVTPHDTGRKRGKPLQFLHDLKRQKGRALSVAGLVSGTSATLYVLHGYAITFATHILHLPMRSVFFISTAAAIVMVPFILLAGHLADRFGGRRVLLLSLMIFLVSILPLSEYLVSQPSLARLVISQLSFAALCGMFLGSYCTVVTEVFDPSSRITTLATMHNLTVMIVGGTSQTMVTWLLATTGSPLASGFFVAVAVLAATVGAAWLAAEQSPAEATSAEQIAAHA